MFEARDRVGGRVHSRTLDDGATIELGAEFILPGHDVLRATPRPGQARVAAEMVRAYATGE